MQTIRQYLFKSITNFFLIVASIIILALLIIVADWILPIKAHNGLLIAVFSSLNEIAFFMGVTIFLFFGYKAASVIKAEKLPKQEFIKMVPAIVIWLSLLIILINVIKGHDRTDCEVFNYNSTLNGGIKKFNDKQYTINICGSGVSDSPFFGDGMDTAQLTIIDEQGDVLAQRRYKISWDAKPGHEPLTIGKESITYQDDEKQRDYVINIPPTFIDWIQARVPLFRI